MMLEEQDRENPTDFLMRVLEDFSKSEPIKVLVVFTTEDGSLQISCNKIDRTSVVGMLVQAHYMILNDWMIKER